MWCLATALAWVWVPAHAGDGPGTPQRCNAEAFRAFDVTRARPGANADAADITLTEPLARTLHARKDRLKMCHTILGRGGPRAGMVNLQARLDVHGVVEDVCVLEDTTGDAATLDCVAGVLRGALFPVGQFPWMFRWRVRLEVE